MQCVLPGEKILLAGSGPLQLVLASQIINAGGRLVAVLEAGTIDSWFGLLSSLWGKWDLLLDGWSYLLSILKGNVPMLRSHMIQEARGAAGVEEALAARVDRDWRPIPGTERVVDVDTVCIGYGLVPSAEITQLANCEHRYRPHFGGWVPERQASMETSVPGVYAVGDGSGVGGSQIAAADRALGYISAAEARGRKKPLDNLLKKYGRFRRFADAVSEPRAGLFELAKEDTILCRCEEVTFKEVTEAISRGGKDVNEIKRMTRAGMGRCQGRMCGPTLTELIRRQRGPELSPLRPRQPFKPIKLVSLVEPDSEETVSRSAE
jgi:hypothetical protein